MTAATNADQATQWRDVIIDHSHFPRRHGPLDQPSHSGEGENPLCGDRVRLQLKINAAGEISESGFEATACAICTASASLLVSHIDGLTSEQALKLFQNVHQILTLADAKTSLEGLKTMTELQALQLVNRYPLRVKCASLPWHVLRQMLEGGVATVSTETNT